MQGYMLCNLTTRFARDTEHTEENNFYPGGRRRPDKTLSRFAAG